MPIIKNITTTLEDDRLLVVWDLSYSIDESNNTHPDNPVKELEESREVQRIESVEYLLNDKIGMSLHWSDILDQPARTIIEKKLLDAIQHNSIEEIKLL